MTIGSFLHLNQLLDAYRNGAQTPEDTVRAVYDRIRAAGDDHVWIYLVPEAEAIERARHLASLPKHLPLFGVPFAIKDNMDVAGLPTTAGCPSFAYVPTRSATVVDKVLSAGGILIGKTNMDQFATGLVGTRSPYGPCASVFHPEYISGGSSSGSAVAVANGIVMFSFGTDTAGSGRVPAALNGIVGLKPSRGLISTAGVVPACKSLDCVSIFARDVQTAGAVLEVVAGPDPADAFSRVGEQRGWTGAAPRLGVPGPDHLTFFEDELSSKCWQQSLARARSLGAEVVEIDFEPFQQAAQLLYAGPFVAERFAAVGEFIQKAPENQIDPAVRSIVMGSARYTAVDVFRAEYRLQELRTSAQKILATVDAILLPTVPTTYKIADVQRNPLELNSRLGTYTNFVNLLDMCGIALPSGLRQDGLPFGITLLSPAHADQAVLDLAHWWEGTDKQPYLTTERSGGIKIAVVGAHLRGQPLNWQLTNRQAEFVETTKTAPFYKLFALTDTVPQKPGLIRTVDKQQVGIEVEVWRLSESAFGSFVSEIPAPLGIGTLELQDGSRVKGFLCEPFATAGAQNITELGGWRRFLNRDAIQQNP